MNNNNIMMVAATILVLVTMVWWYSSHPYFVFFTKPTYSANNTADFINKYIKEEDGIMAQAGYTEVLAYQIKNRILGLPPKSENLLYLIDYYNISYVLYGSFYTSERYFYAKESINFITSHPEKFTLTVIINEDYGNLRRSSKENIYIYEVIK